MSSVVDGKCKTYYARESIPDRIESVNKPYVKGTRLAHCIKMHKRLFGVDVQKGKKAKARLKMTEILYIFFGIHTANAVELSSRIAGLQPATR